MSLYPACEHCSMARVQLHCAWCPSSTAWNLTSFWNLILCGRPLTCLILLSLFSCACHLPPLPSLRPCLMSAPHPPGPPPPCTSPPCTCSRASTRSVWSCTPPAHTWTMRSLTLRSQLSAHSRAQPQHNNCLCSTLIAATLHLQRMSSMPM